MITASDDTLYVRVANYIRSLIESEDLGPGDRLPTERQLAEVLGVSRVPIREAIRTLSAQGIIEVRRGQGMFVASKGIEATMDQLTSALSRQRNTFTDLFAVRRLVEPASAQWAASRVDDEGVAHLQTIIDKMSVAANAEPPDLATMAELDARLHIEIAVCSDNAVLVRIMQAIQDWHRAQLETSLRYDGRVKETLQDHRRIVSAIAERDPVAAGLAMADHVTKSATATFGRINA